MKPTTMLKDNDGYPVRDGDSIRFCYGTPPVVVTADIEQEGDRLIAVMPPGHYPPEMNLRLLRGHVGAWFKVH